MDAPSPMPTSLPVAEQPARILLVEDDALVAEACAMLLEDFGYTIRRAESAEDALAVLSSGATFDLVFSDVRMPGAGGLELARTITHLYPGLPVVLTTGYSSAAAEAIESGFALLPKPYLPADVQRAIAAALGHTRRTGT